MAEYETDGSSALAPNDPYKGMDRGEGIRPNFRAIDGGGQGDGKPRGKFRSAAQNNLAGSEQTAANPISSLGEGTNAAKSAEQNQPFSRVQGRDLKTDNKDTRTRGFLRKKGPLVAIIAVILGGGGVAFVGQLGAPFSYVANALNNRNFMRTSMNRRTTYFNRFMMDSKRNKSLTKYGIFSGEKFKISSSLRKKLAKQNIDYDEVDGVRLLYYNDSETGSRTPIVATEADLAKLPADIANPTTGPPAVTLDTALQTMPDFDTAQDKATRTMRGHIAGWFESVSGMFHKRIQNSRNRFGDLPKKATSEEIQAAAKRSGISGDSGETDFVDAGTEPEDPDAEPDPTTTEVDTEADDALKATPGEAQSESSIRSKVTAKMQKAATGANYACMIAKATGAISAAVAGLQIAQIINYVTGFLNAVQQTQAGDGGEELAYYMNGLNTLGTTNDSDGNVVSTNTSAWGSSAINSQFGGNPVNQSDPVAQKFNIEYMINKGVGAAASFGASVTAFQTCTLLQVGLATAGAVTDIVLLFTTVGIGNAIKALFKGIGKAALKTTIIATISAIVSAITPYIASLLARDLITNMAGEDAGYVIDSGINIYLGKSYQANGASPGNTEALRTAYLENQIILAEEAAQDRRTRSPFDISSPNTFFGSITNQFAALGSSPTFSSFGRILSSSALSFFPTAHAADELTSLSLNNDCPVSSYFDIAVDAYCNPYYVTDFSTISEDPATVFDNVGEDKFDGQDSDGNPIIKNSHDSLPTDLEKYIIACTARDSQWGLVDSNVQSIISNPTGNQTADTIISTGVGVVPIVGDLVDLADAAVEADNLKWNSGQACIQTSDANVNPDWQKNKYYQRYVEDQTLMEAAGLIEKSAVTAYLEDYYAEHPLDNSYEGIIARYSGMTKEEVTDTIALAEYIDWLASYDPTDLSPMPAEHVNISLAEQIPEAVIADHHTSPTSSHILYIDNRNRNFAA